MKVSFKELGLVNTREMFAKAAWELEFAAGKFDRDLVNDKLEDTFAESEAIVDAFLCA